MIYIVLISVLVLAYAGVVWLMDRIKNTKRANLVFCGITFFFYALYLLKLMSNVGYNNYYFLESLPTANISPFMFGAIPIIFFSRGRVQKHLNLLVSLLSIGMLLSPILNAIMYAIKDTTFGIIFVFDYIAHLSLSLWGIYLVKSGQTRLNVRDSIISSLIILGICDIMIILNLIFDTSFFGLSLTGKHHIYYNVITSNSFLSALIYFIGLCAVLFAGFASCKWLSGSRRNYPPVKENNKKG